MKDVVLFPPPSGGQLNICHIRSQREGEERQREACLQISAISRLDCLPPQCRHRRSFPLDVGERRGLDANAHL